MAYIVSLCCFCGVVVVVVGVASTQQATMLGNGRPGADDRAAAAPSAAAADDDDDDSVSAEQETLTDDDIRQLFSRFVMQQILTKLRLPASPNVTGNGRAIPEPLDQQLSKDMMMQSDQPTTTTATAASRLYQNYKHSNQIVIFAKPCNSSRCSIRRSESAACFELNIPADIRPHSVSGARLMVYKRRGHSGHNNHTLAVYEMTGPNHSVPKASKDHGSARVSVTHGWVAIDLKSYVVRHWAARPGKHLLKVDCKKCRQREPIELDGQLAPFLEVRVRRKGGGGGGGGGHRRVRRSRRMHRSCQQNPRSCCLHEQYIDFAELGEDTWIRRPAGFHANYCSGSCSIRDIPYVIPRTLRHRLFNSLEMVERILSMCCVPDKLISLDLLYWDTDGNLRKETIDNLIVETCECR